MISKSTLNITAFISDVKSDIILNLNAQNLKGNFGSAVQILTKWDTYMKPNDFNYSVVGNSKNIIYLRRALKLFLVMFIIIKCTQ